MARKIAPALLNESRKVECRIQEGHIFFSNFQKISLPIGYPEAFGNSSAVARKEKIHYCS